MSTGNFMSKSGGSTPSEESVTVQRIGEVIETN